MASTKSIEYFLQGAEDAYWFSMEEGGNAEALRNGLELLNEVENFDDFSSDTGLQERVNALKVDLDKQLELTHDTLFGVFPVVRFATDSLMANSGSLGTYEILDDPSVMAATSAVDRLREVLAQTIELYGQLDVFLVSNPRNHDLENEAIFMLNKDPNFFVHSRANMVSILGKKNLDELYSKVSKAEGKLDNFFDAHAMKMRSNFRNNQVLMVNIRKTRNLNSVNKFYVVGGDVWRLGSTGEAPKQIGAYKSYGFSRDRSHLFWPISVLNISVFLFLICYLKFGNSGAYAKSLSFFVLLFLLGRVWPSVLGSFSSGLAPSGEELWFVSFWFPLLFFCMLVMMPMALTKMLSEKFFSSWMNQQKLNSLLPPLVLFLGLYLALATDLLLWSCDSLPLELEQLTILFSLGLSLFLTLLVQSEFAFGDKKMSRYWPFIYFSALGLMSWGYFSNQSIPLLSSVAILLPLSIQRFRNLKESGFTDTPEITDFQEGASNDPLSFLHEPPFIEFEDTSSFLGSAVFAGSKILITGGNGSGKTRTAKLVSKYLDQHNGNMIILLGKSANQYLESESQNPFGVFANLLGLGEIKLGASDENAGLSDMVSNVAEKFPLISLFRNFVSNAVDSTGMLKIEKSFEREFKDWLLYLYRKTGRKVLLLIEDIHNADESSKELLKSLLSWKPFLMDRKISDGWLTIIVTSIKESSEEYESLFSSQLNLQEQFNSSNQLSFLKNALNLSHSSSLEIVEKFRKIRDGNWTWFLQVVRSLFKDGFMICNDSTGVYEFTKEFKSSSGWQMTEFSKLIDSQLLEFPQYHSVLRAACILGSDFRSSELADILERPLVEVLEVLHEIERNTGWVLDEFLEDDFFHIPSLYMQSFTLFFQICHEGKKAVRTPQLIREIHALAATTLEKNLDAYPSKHDSSRIYEVADHYHFSGPSKGTKALNWNLKAATLAAKCFQFDSAKWRLDMADEYANSLEEKKRVHKKRVLLIDSECSTKRDIKLAKMRLEICAQHLNFCPEGDLETEIINLRARHEYSDEEAVEKEEKTMLWKENFLDGESILLKLNDIEKKEVSRSEVLQFMALAKSRLLELAIVNKNGETDEEKEKSQILELYSEALSELKENSDPAVCAQTAKIYDSLARFQLRFPNSYQDGKKENLAKVYFEKSISIKRDIDDKLGLAISLYGLADFHEKDGDKKGALSYFQETAKINMEIGSFEFAARTFLKISSLEEKKDAAVLSLQKVRDILNSGELGQSEDARSIAEEVEKISTSLDSTISNENV